MTTPHGFASLGLVLLLVIGLAVLGGGGWYVSQQGMLESPPPEITSATTSPQNTESVASGADTVITEASTQIGEFTGYYEPVEREGWNEGVEFAMTCDTFVVLSGAPKLTQYFKDMVSSGNAIHSITTQGQLRINLPWSEVPEADKAAIQASASSSPITLSLKKKVQEGVGVGPCYSFFSYLRIES